MSKREKPVISFTLDEELIERLDKFRFKNEISSRSKAVSQLLEIALNEIEMLEEVEPKEISVEEELDYLMKTIQGLKERVKE